MTHLLNITPTPSAETNAAVLSPFHLFFILMAVVALAMVIFVVCYFFRKIPSVQVHAVVSGDIP
jgi:hypothetical protein